jgi:protein-tyrosine-phosphatase
MSAEPISVAFVCVQNAGRSQMATAFAERERERRDLEGRVDVRTGGTDPADHVHEGVVEAMREAGFDLSDRVPREIPREELLDVDVVVTMGCSAGDVCPATWRGDARDWGLDDPDGRPPEEVRRIRDEIAERVSALFDEFEAASDA